MSTKITYQQLGNTLRLVTVKDIAMDINVFDAITSPNNSVLHGGVCVNYLATATNPSAPTSNTGDFAFFAFYSTSVSASNTTLTLTLSNNAYTPEIRLFPAVGNIIPITIDGTTFYGTRASSLQCLMFSGSTPCGICTAPIKITVIKCNTTSQEITTETYNIESKSGNASSPMSGRSTVAYATLQIAKTSDDILLFVGIENIFE